MLIRVFSSARIAWLILAAAASTGCGSSSVVPGSSGSSSASTSSAVGPSLGMAHIRGLGTSSTASRSRRPSDVGGQLPAQTDQCSVGRRRRHDGSHDVAKRIGTEPVHLSWPDVVCLHQSAIRHPAAVPTSSPAATTWIPFLPVKAGIRRKRPSGTASLRAAPPALRSCSDRIIPATTITTPKFPDTFFPAILRSRWASTAILDTEPKARAHDDHREQRDRDHERRRRGSVLELDLERKPIPQHGRQRPSDAVRILLRLQLEQPEWAQNPTEAGDWVLGTLRTVMGLPSSRRPSRAQSSARGRCRSIGTSPHSTRKSIRIERRSIRT